MKKLLLTMTALLATAGATAQGTFVKQNFSWLTADELNAVTSSKRFAIECIQNANYCKFYDVTRLTSDGYALSANQLSSTDLPESMVFEWEKVSGEDKYYIKSLATGNYLTSANITTYAAAGTDNLAKFTAVKPGVGGSGLTGGPVEAVYSDYNEEAERAYWVRFSLSSSSWFNFNGKQYNGGTGVWTVQHAVDLSDYYKLTLNIVKGSETTTIVSYRKVGSDIVAPDYSSENYVTDYVVVQKTADDTQSLTITYVEDSEKAQLQALINQANAMESGDQVGQFTVASKTALDAAVKSAQDKMSGIVSTEDVEALQNVINAMERNMPVAGKFYQLATWKTENTGKVAFAKTDNTCWWGFNETPAAVWVFEAAADGEYYLKNLATGTYMDNYISNSGTSPDPNVLVETKNTVSVVPANDGRKVGIKVGNNIFLDRDQNNPDNGGSKAMCHWTEDHANVSGNRMWLINEVEPSTIKHTITMGAAGWATVVLGFNATIPSNAKVYVVESTTSTVATLKPVTGVLGANTAVLVKAAEGTVVDFAYSAETVTVTESKLSGTLYDKNITPDAGKTCYVLSKPEGKEAGFYKAELNQESSAAFKNNANKAYLSIDTPVDGEAPSLSFVFDTETGIQGIDAAKAEGAIYDLSGRRVKAATKGIFIINGKKVIK